ncbi:MAG: ATP-binding cassette domain-containing protein [Blautia marasmi]
MKAIETNHLTKKYKDVTAVDALCLSVEQGELFALLGVNGAGKTTTIKMLSCLTAPSGGDAHLLGDSVVTAPMKVKEKSIFPPGDSSGPQSDRAGKSGVCLRYLRDRKSGGWC